MKIIDKIAQRFVKSATAEVVVELDQVKQTVTDAVPVIVTLVILGAALLGSRTHSKTVAKAGVTVVRHIYHGTTTIINH